MAGKWSGYIARWLSKRAGKPAADTGPAKETDSSPNQTAEIPADPATTAPNEFEEPPGPEIATALEETNATSPETTNATSPKTTNEANADAADAEGGAPADGQPGEPGSESSEMRALPGEGAPATAPVPVTGAEPGTRSQKVVTLVALGEHAGTRTVAAAMAGRARGKGWTLRTSGPGLTRAAFSGMLNGTDAVVLVAPPEPEATSVLREKLDWFEANNRPAMAGKTVFVINLGASHQESGDTSGLQLPADLERPLVLLPYDPALSSGTPARAPRRAARRALDQLIEELSTIFQEH